MSEQRREVPAGVTVRRVRADDWERIRNLRLEALRDPMASVAFLETVEAAAARPDEEWQARATANAAGDASAQFVAERGGELVGSLAVIVRAAGVPDYFRRVPDADQPTVVGVYVSPSVRGRGVIDALLAGATEWASGCGHRILTLDVHETNLGAIGAYERSGFEVCGSFVGDNGRELGMIKEIGPAR
jgi:GNAT superfamily N-acetyltransferase